MKRNHVLFLSLLLLFSTVFISSIISEDDPFAGMDMGAPADAGADQQVSPDNSGVPGDDPMAGMDHGADAGGSADMGASADVLFPDATAAEGGVLPGEGDMGMDGTDLPGMGGETGMPGMGQDAALPATGVEQAPPLQLPGEKKPATTVKSGTGTHKGVTKTDDIYTKSSYIGGFRNLRDIMTWGVKATSKLSPENNADKLNDNIVDTAWIEGKKDGGKKQVITFDFAEKHFIGLYEKKYHKVKIGKIMILNGAASDKAAWKKYFRVKKLKVTQNKKLKFYIVLHDTMNWQTITMKKPLIIKPGDVIRAEIMESFPEIRREDDTYVAVTEFTFLGEPYGPKVEPKYIQKHLQGME